MSDPGGPPPHIIAVAAYKGGVGKTHIAACLAAMLGTRHPTVAIDLDEQGDVALKLGLDIPDGTGDVLDWLHGQPGAGLVKVPTAPYAFVIDPSPRLLNADTCGLLTTTAIRAAATRDSLRYVILDTPYLGAPIAQRALTVADLALLVACDELSIAHLDIALTLAAEADVDAAVVLNRQHGDSRTDAQVCAAYAAQHPDRVCPVRIRTDGWAAVAFRRHTSPLAVHPQASAPDDFRDLARWVSATLDTPARPR